MSGFYSGSTGKVKNAINGSNCCYTKQAQEHVATSLGFTVKAVPVHMMYNVKVGWRCNFNPA